jgi:hypothetical protein
MNLQIIVRALLCVVLLSPTPGLAFETDQYNLPPQPLADIGDEVSEYTETNLRKAVDKINGEILARQSCLEKTARNSSKLKCGSTEKEREKLNYLRSEAAVAREVYELLGAGFPPFTKSDTWLNSHEFKNQPARYKPDWSESIFALNPINHFTLSPTVKIYGSQFGTDKIAHFFQQGYTYYKTYTRALAENKTPDEAVRKAVRWGRMTERTYYGTLLSGVYSNGDLAANYAGLKFYQGLTHDIKIGDVIRLAVLILKNGVWAINDGVDLRRTLIKPFMTDHFNEALNPSIFTTFLGLRSYVRRTVRKHSCDEWRRQHPNLSQTDLTRDSQSLRFWYGEDYGFKSSDDFVTIQSVCFEQKKAD